MTPWVEFAEDVLRHIADGERSTPTKTRQTDPDLAPGTMRNRSSTAVDPLPEILKSQRRLQRLFRSNDLVPVRRAFDLAGIVIQAWIATDWSTRFQPTWNFRLTQLAPTSAIGVDEAALLASFPERVLLATLMLNPPVATSDPHHLYQAMAEAMGRGLGIAYTGRARFDPLFRYFCQTQVE